MADFGSVGQFDAYTSFGGPYALHSRSAGSVIGHSTNPRPLGFSGTVGGGVHPMSFGHGISAIGAVVGSAMGAYGARAYKQRKASFSKQAQTPRGRITPATGTDTDIGPPTSLPTLWTPAASGEQRSQRGRTSYFSGVSV